MTRVTQGEKITIDAQGKPLGRVASQIATALMGKNRTEYTPRQTPNIQVEVIHSNEITFSGAKLQQKRYYRHSQYPGHLRSESLAELLARDPQTVLIRAVRGMLPNNKLRPLLLRRLTITTAKEQT